MSDQKLLAKTAISQFETFMLPDLIGKCPFKLQINPNYDIAKVEAEQWLKSYGIKDVEKINKWQFPLLATLTHRTIDAKRLCTLAKYYLWVFIWDDFFDDGEFSKSPEDAQHAAELTVKVLHNPETVPKTSFTAAEMLRNVILEIKKDAPETCYKRLVRHLLEYIDAALQQVINRTSNIDLNLNSYMELRRHASGVAPSFDLIKYALNLDISDEVINDATVQKLSLCCHDLILLTNDVYSFNVEQSWGETHNLVVIAMAQGRSLRESMSFIEDLIEGRWNMYAAEKKALRSWGSTIDQDVATYLLSMEQWVIGYLHWSLSTERYFGTAVEEVKKTRVVTVLPRKGKSGQEGS